MTFRLLLCLLLLGTTLVTTGVLASAGGGCGDDCMAIQHDGDDAGNSCGDGACSAHERGCTSHCMPAIQTLATPRVPRLAASQTVIDICEFVADSPPERPLRPPIPA